MTANVIVSARNVTTVIIIPLPLYNPRSIETFMKLSLHNTIAKYINMYSILCYIDHIVRAVSLYVAADCADIWHTHQTRENVSQTLLHTVSRKHVIQPGNRSKTLGLSLNVPQVSNTPSTISLQSHAIGWADCTVAERDRRAATSENTCK